MKMLLSKTEIEKMLQGETIEKNGFPVSVSRETVDFYKGEYKGIEEISHEQVKALKEQGYFKVGNNSPFSYYISENYPNVYKVKSI